MYVIKAIDFVKKNCEDNQIICTEKNTNYACVLNLVNENHYDKDTKAVKVYYGCPDNDDGEKDFYVGEAELDERFCSFGVTPLD